MNELELYCLLDLYGVDYEEATIKLRGGKTIHLRGIKTPIVTYRYDQIEKNKWNISESLDGGPYKLILTTETDDISEFFKAYPWTELYSLTDCGKFKELEDG